MSKKRGKSRRYVGVAKALKGTKLALYRRPEMIFITAEDVPVIVDRLKSAGYRIVRIKRRRVARKAR